MLMQILEFLLGLALVIATFRDLVETVVVPGGAHNSLRVSRRLVSITLPLWTRGARRQIGVSFAPAILIASFAVWILLLIVGFALMAHGARSQFTPPLEGFDAALFMAGSALTTIGTGPSHPHGLAAVVAVACGLTGLASMTMAVTYVLEVQATVHERDRGVLKISTSAGEPPCALTLLERYAELGCRSELAVILRNAREWCAAVLQSHASHPWLIYFRSPSVATAWPTSLGAVMDLGLIFERLLDEQEHCGLGALVRQQAECLSTQLVELVRLEPEATDASTDDVGTLMTRLEAAGYRLRSGIDAAAFARERADCTSRIEALCRHLGAGGAPLVAEQPSRR
ncbi:ion channel [Lysobacter sp. HA18]